MYDCMNMCKYKDLDYKTVNHFTTQKILIDFDSSYTWSKLCTLVNKVSETPNKESLSSNLQGCFQNITQKNRNIKEFVFAQEDLFGSPERTSRQNHSYDRVFSSLTGFL